MASRGFLKYTLPLVTIQVLYFKQQNTSFALDAFYLKSYKGSGPRRACYILWEKLNLHAR